MNFQWLNESNLTKEGEKITIYAPAGTDFFCNDGTVSEEGVTPESLHNAPFYYTELSGDFVLTVKVSHDFKDTYDSSSLMVMEDLKNWAKSCFEKTTRIDIKPLLRGILWKQAAHENEVQFLL